MVTVKQHKQMVKYHFDYLMGYNKEGWNVRCLDKTGEHFHVVDTAGAECEMHFSYTESEDNIDPTYKIQSRVVQEDEETFVDIAIVNFHDDKLHQIV